MSNTTLARPVTGAQIIVETLYALLALASIVLFGLRQISLLGPAFQVLGQSCAVDGLHRVRPVCIEGRMGSMAGSRQASLVEVGLG